MNFWIVRHKAMGTILPARVPATRFEFTPGKHPEPRLFATERAAKNCARCWSQGVWEMVVQRGGDWELGYYDEPGCPAPTNTLGRNYDDLEIVQVRMEILK